MTLICPQCERSFEPNAPHQIYDVDACRQQGWVEKEVEAAQASVQRVEQHPLVEARAEQEASELNDRLGQIVYNAIIDRLKIAGRVHADDLEGYFPEDYRERCRKLVPGQLGSLRGKRYIQPTSEYLKSKVPARKGGKSWVYVFTQKGRAKLVGVTAGVSPPRGASQDVSGHSGEKVSGVGVPSSQKAERSVATSDCADAGASPEPLSLFQEAA